MVIGFANPEDDACQVAAEALVAVSTWFSVGAVAADTTTGVVVVASAVAIPAETGLPDSSTSVTAWTSIPG